MTEANWGLCRNPWLMIPQLGQRATDRKVRLFLCACCRHCLDSLPHAELLEAVAWAERHIDQRAAAEEAAAVQEAIRLALMEMSESVNYLAEAVYPLVYAEPVISVALSIDFLVQALEAEGLGEFERNLERAGQCRLLREIFGNPHHPLRIEPAWRTADVLGLAEAIYQTQDYERMPILADALEDAGCDDAEMLRHCRQEEGHVRGCWVVDGVLGKE